MSRAQRPIIWMAVTLALLATLLGACTRAAVDPAAGTSPTTVASSAANAVTIDITVRGGKVTPSGEKIDVDRGQTVVLNVMSDSNDEVHAHTAGDGYELEVRAGQPARGQFVANDTGTFEVELHELDLVVAILVVR